MLLYFDQISNYGIVQILVFLWCFGIGNDETLIDLRKAIGADDVELAGIGEDILFVAMAVGDAFDLAFLRIRSCEAFFDADAVAAEEADREVHVFDVFIGITSY